MITIEDGSLFEIPVAIPAFQTKSFFSFMTPAPPDNTSERGLFPTTRWTLIRKLQEGNEEQARAALENFCRAYWYPVYAYCRHSGFPVETAEDLTQTYFQQLIGYDSMKKVAPELGRLRYFVLSSLKRLIANHLRHELATKRRPDKPLLSLSLGGGEEAYLSEPASISDPMSLFDRAWAESVMAGAEERLRSEFEIAGTSGHFLVLGDFLPHRSGALSQAEAAHQLGISDGAFRLHLHRMRKRFVRLVELEISEFVSDPAALREEVAYLVDLISK